VTPGKQALSLAEIEAAVTKAFPGERISGYGIPVSPDLGYQAVLTRRMAYVESCTAQVLRAQNVGVDFPR